ncbi:MAG: hypothetical protein WBY44_17310 [Bryobacteraceae bacterium]|jgi:hypothetical protein
MGEERKAVRAIHIGADGVHINYPISRPAIARFGFYVAVLAIALVVWQVQESLFSRSYIETQTEALTPLQEKQLDAFLQMNQLLITLATATMGALGFMLSQGKTRRWRELLSAAASAVFAGCSLYFGYLAYQGILWMLQSSFFNLDNAAIQWTRHLHFYALLLSVFFFADFIIHDIGKEDRNAVATSVAAP